MTISTTERKADVIPIRRRKHYSYDESLDEPAKLIADEPMDVERETPAEENEPVERIDEPEKGDSPAFDE